MSLSISDNSSPMSSSLSPCNFFSTRDDIFSHSNLAIEHKWIYCWLFVTILREINLNYLIYNYSFSNADWIKPNANKSCKMRCFDFQSQNRASNRKNKLTQIDEMYGTGINISVIYSCYFCYPYRTHWRWSTDSRPRIPSYFFPFAIWMAQYRFWYNCVCSQWICIHLCALRHPDT